MVEAREDLSPATRHLLQRTKAALLDTRKTAEQIQRTTRPPQDLVQRAVISMTRAGKLLDKLTESLERQRAAPPREIEQRPSSHRVPGDGSQPSPNCHGRSRQLDVVPIDLVDRARAHRSEGNFGAVAWAGRPHAAALFLRRSGRGRRPGRWPAGPPCCGVLFEVWSLAAERGSKWLPLNDWNPSARNLSMVRSSCPGQQVGRLPYGALRPLLSLGCAHVGSASTRCSSLARGHLARLRARVCRAGCYEPVSRRMLVGSEPPDLISL